MGLTASKLVSSNQLGIHPRILEIVQRHRDHVWKKPISSHTELAFGAVVDTFSLHLDRMQHGLILDSGCGTGESCLRLAALYPDQWVLGIDQSQARLQQRKLNSKGVAIQGNVIWVRAECADFWRLLCRDQIKISKHYLLYPNPWPKAEHVMRRWHGHPVFGTLCKLTDQIELRTNWRMYADEFSCALNLLGIRNEVSNLCFDKESLSRINLTPFEQKYALSNHPLWVVRVVGG